MAVGTVGPIASRLDCVWRTLVTGFGFLLFLTMGVLFRLIVCPILSLCWRNGIRKRRLLARRIVQLSFAAFIATMRLLRGMDLTVVNGERLGQGPLLLCPSHPTLLDVVVLISKIANANCIVKARLMDSPAMTGPITTAGYITNDHGPDLIEDCAASLAQGDTLIIFPEGTRTQPGVRPKLQHGAAAVALHAGCNITPVRIECVPPTLMKGIAWYTIPERRFRITVTVLDDIDIAPYARELKIHGRPKAVRHLTQCLLDTLFPLSEEKHKNE